MNTVQNGKGDRPRNNWGTDWYAGYNAINWPREQSNQESPTYREGENPKSNREIMHPVNVHQTNESTSRIHP
jgi:hypothetical protein